MFWEIISDITDISFNPYFLKHFIKKCIVGLRGFNGLYLCDKNGVKLIDFHKY